MKDFTNIQISAALSVAYARHARDVFEHSNLYNETKDKADERLKERECGARDAIRDLADELGIYINFQSIIDEIAKDYTLR